jgi:uncharacterized protein (DUF1499 family)
MFMKSSMVSNTALIMSILGILTAVVMVFGSQLGLWEPIVGFSASRNYNDTIGYFVVALGVISILFSVYQKQSSAILKSAIATIIGIAILSSTIYQFFNTPTSYPPIHDITTNVDNPPEFIAITEERLGAKNSLIYGGVEISEQQLKAFPQIQPIITSINAQESYARSLHIAELMKWEIVSENKSLMRFEATDRTPFFNFADDIVVQITEQENGSRIDLRSVSRIGRGDRGVNAQRIIKFITLFEHQQ